VVGAVDPGAETALAATKNGHLGVIGTLGKIRSGAYAAAIAARDPKAVLVAQACPLLVPLAEEGWVDASDPIATLVAERYLLELFARDRAIDTLVLGCTHYPLLRGVIARVAESIAGHAVAIVDSADAMARVARAQLGAHEGKRGKLSVFATDTSRLDEVAPRFLGEPLADYQLVDL
jgi:glutamate racemase